MKGSGTIQKLNRVHKKVYALSTMLMGQLHRSSEVYILINNTHPLYYLKIIYKWP